MLIFSLRAHLRRGTYGIDDALAAGATFIQGAQVAAVLVALRNGAGIAFNLLSTDEIHRAGRAVFAATILFIVAATLAKAAVVILAMRLFNLSGARASHNANSSTYRYCAFGVLGLIGIWGIGSLLAVSIQCSPSTYIDASTFSTTCQGQTSRWAAVMVVDVLTEVLIVLLAIIIVLPLQLPFAMKVPVMLAFTFRLPCAVLAILHYVYVGPYVNKNPDGLAIVPLLNFMQVELCWSLLSATIPNLKAFVQSFNSGFGLGLDLQTAYPGTAVSGRQAQYEMNSWSKSNHRSQVKSDAESEREIIEHTVSDTRDSTTLRRNASTNEGNGSIASLGSQEQIIRKDIQWHVSYEDNAHAR